MSYFILRKLKEKHQKCIDEIVTDCSSFHASHGRPIFVFNFRELRQSHPQSTPLQLFHKKVFWATTASMRHLGKKLLFYLSKNPLHSCAILARIFWVLAWDRKISRYLGIVLRLSLNLIILGIGIGIEIEIWVLQYWYWDWYLFLMFVILILRSKFLGLVSFIGISQTPCICKHGKTL